MIKCPTILRNLNRFSGDYMKVEIPENITWKNLKSGIVLLNLDSSEYYTLNETASVIWKGIIDNNPFHKIIKNLIEIYDQDECQINKDFEEQIQFFIDEKLLINE